MTRIVRGGQHTGLLSAVWSPSFRQEQLVVFILREIYNFCLAAYLVFSFPRILILPITMEQDSSWPVWWPCFLKWSWLSVAFIDRQKVDGDSAEPFSPAAFAPSPPVPSCACWLKPWPRSWPMDEATLYGSMAMHVGSCFHRLWSLALYMWSLAQSQISF